MLVIILTVLTALAFFAVIGTLVMGAIAMKGKDLKDREMSNKWMQRRVTAQVLAIGMLILTVYVRSNGGG